MEGPFVKRQRTRSQSRLVRMLMSPAPAPAMRLTESDEMNESGVSSGQSSESDVGTESQQVNSNPCKVDEGGGDQHEELTEQQPVASPAETASDVADQEEPAAVAIDEHEVNESGVNAETGNEEDTQEVETMIEASDDEDVRIVGGTIVSGGDFEESVHDELAADWEQDLTRVAEKEAERAQKAAWLSQQGVIHIDDDDDDDDDDSSVAAIRNPKPPTTQLRSDGKFVLILDDSDDEEEEEEEEKEEKKKEAGGGGEEGGRSQNERQSTTTTTTTTTTTLRPSTPSVTASIRTTRTGNRASGTQPSLSSRPRISPGNNASTSAPSTAATIARRRRGPTSHRENADDLVMLRTVASRPSPATTTGASSSTSNQRVFNRSPHPFPRQESIWDPALARNEDIPHRSHLASRFRPAPPPWDAEWSPWPTPRFDRFDRHGMRDMAPSRPHDPAPSYQSRYQSRTAGEPPPQSSSRDQGLFYQAPGPLNVATRMDYFGRARRHEPVSIGFGFRPMTSSKPVVVGASIPAFAQVGGASSTGAGEKMLADSSEGKRYASILKEGECSVCLDPMKEISSTVCGHVFCRVCIVASIKARGQCPVCRTTLKEDQVHRLFI